MKIIAYILLLLGLLNTLIFSQQACNIKLSITDSVVIMKRKHESVQLNIKLTVDNKCNDTVNLFMFNRQVHSDPFIVDSLSMKNIRYNNLTYFIEDNNGNIVIAESRPLVSFKKFKDEINYYNTIFYIDTNKLKVRSKVIKSEKDFMNIYMVDTVCLSNNKNEFLTTVYPIIGHYHKLNKGVYYLFLFYSHFEKNNPIFINQDLKYNHIINNKFIGTLKSNKIKLVVK